MLFVELKIAPFQYEPETFTWLSDARAVFLRDGICTLHREGLPLANLEVLVRFMH